MDQVVVFLFRRDFRIHDNTTFIEVVKRANLNNWKIIPAFIFNPKQIDPVQNEYYSSNSVQFMIQSLRDLEGQLEKEHGKLYYFKGSDREIFEKLNATFDVKCVASNKDITPFALKRDEEVRHWCDRKGIEFLSMEDYTMYPIEQVRTNQGKPFEIYTPFYRRAIRIPVPEPHIIPEVTTTFVVGSLEYEDSDVDKYYTLNINVMQKGGRDVALEILEKIRVGGFRKFKKEHDIPIKDGTTKLSAYLKFGCISVREAFKVMKDAVGKASLLVGQLYYRDFYYHIAYHFPEILKGQVGEKSTPMHGRYEKADWNDDIDQLEKWKTGQTGYPIVDAAMRCLNETGWLHGRLRMIVAMFLVRDLNIDWRVGEKYFASKLVDYDPASNSQGWCWVLSYRRKFNPYKQTGKYDEQCEFVKKWVPELVDVPVLALICWWEKFAEYPDLNYPKPIVDIQGYRVKFKTYIPDYVRPKDPNYKKTPKKSKYGQNKNPEKYNKNKERNQLLKQQQRQQQQGGDASTSASVVVPRPSFVQPPPSPQRVQTQPVRNLQGLTLSQPPRQEQEHIGYPRAPVPRPYPRPPPPQKQQPRRDNTIYPRAPVSKPLPQVQKHVETVNDEASSSTTPKVKPPRKFPTFILPDPKYFAPNKNSNV